MRQWLLAACAVLLCADGVAAQSPATTSPFLPPDHWSYRVLRRFDGAGLLPAGSDIARRTMPQEEVAGLLEFAAESDTLGFAAAHLHRFREEFPEPQTPRLTRLDASALGLVRVQRHLVRPGIGYDTAWSGARPVEDDTDADALVRTAVGSRHFGAALAANRDGIEELQVALTAGGLGMWGGRRQLGYAVAAGGGVAVDAPRLDGGGIYFTRPARLPLLGPLRLEVHVAKITNRLNFNDAEEEIEPWFFTMRASVQPHPRLSLGMNRGIVFGGEGNYPVTVKRVAQALALFSNEDGENAFANQILSGDVRFRPPLGALPLTLYLEWGTEDASGAWWDVPGRIGGAEISMLPARDLAVGLERAEFARNATRHSNWYQNAWFRGSWADDGNLLAHPLGGHGAEWRLFASGSAGRVIGDVAAFTRHRRGQNLFAPERAGTSIGGALNADAQLSAAVRLRLSAEVEQGNDVEYTALNARAGLHVRF